MTSPTLKNAPSPARVPTREHRISRSEAAELVRRYRASAGEKAIFASMFGRSIFDAILAQEGCAAIRAYYATDEDGSPTLALVGVDSTGADMWNGVLGEEHYPCPPFCPPGPGFDSALPLPTTNIAPHTLTRRDHLITREEAKVLISRYRENSPDDALHASMFYRTIFDEILAQEGCTAIRLHYAAEDDGSPTLVLVGVDVNGADMWDGVLGEQHYPCPPWCPPGPAFDE